MWSVRRAVYTLKKQGHFLEVPRLFSVRCDTLINFSEDKASWCYPAQLGSRRFFPNEENYHNLIFGKFFLGNRRLSSQASEGRGENDMQDASLELREPRPTPVIEDTDVEEEEWEEWVLEPRFLDDDLSDSEEGVSIREPLKKKDSLELFRNIMDSPSHSISSIINNFVKEGKDLSHSEASRMIFNLLNRRMYGKALKLSDWMETTKHFDLNEYDYAFRLDLIAKVRKVDMAEKYMEKIPDSFRGELLYRTLLSNFVYTVNRKKAEAVFKKMKDLGLLTTHACNQMIILYKRFDRKIIPNILLLMKENNLKPSRLTYRVLIANKGELNDTMGMEHLVEEMKSEGLQPDIHVLINIASHYTSKGLKEKAIAILKEIEGGNLEESIVARSALLSLYASLDMADEVSRLWNRYKLEPSKRLCLAAIAAWGKLGRVEEAEEVFEMILQKWTKLTSRYYSELLRVYVQNNQMSKGKELIKRLENSGCWIGPLIWDGLVRLYAQSGEVDKAASILSRAAQRQKGVRPMFNTFLFVMEQYAERGDIHKTEKWFLRMRLCGYTGRLRPFEILIRAYLNAETPTYGLIERMKAENVFPNKAFGEQLAKLDVLKRQVLTTKPKGEPLLGSDVL